MSRVDWQALERTPLFEDMVSVLISRIFPKAKRIDGSGGDGGRDLQIREGDELRLFELKSFTGRVTKGRRTQVERSLAKAALLNPISWTLVVPINHNPTELEWFDGLRQIYAFPLDWKDKDWLDDRMAEFEDIRKYYLDGQNDEVVALLRELNAEEAAVVSAAEGVERFVRLRSRLNSADPQYSLEITNGSVEVAELAFPDAVLHRQESGASGTISISVVPKYLDAPRDRPVMFRATIDFPDTEIGQQAAANFQTSIDYGDPAEVGPEYLPAAAIDAPGGIGGELGSGYLRVWPANERIQQPLNAKLTTFEPSGRRLASLPVTLTTRYGGALGVTMRGQDSTGVIGITLRFNSTDNRVGFGLRATPPDEFLPGVLLHVLRFARTLQTPNLISVAISDDTVLDPQPVSDVNLVTSEFLTIIEKISRIQAETNTSFAVPNGVDSTDVAAVNRVIRLLDGEALPIVPEERHMVLTEAPSETSIPGRESMSFGYQAEMWQPLFGEEIPLGECFLVMWPVQLTVDQNEESRHVVHVIPDEGAQATIRRGTAGDNPPPQLARP